MSNINPIPAATHRLLQTHLSTPESIAALQRQLKAIIYTDANGHLVVESLH